MTEPISPKISVVIAAYNHALTIGNVVSDTIASLKSLGYPYEVIVIDDGSVDLTGEIAKEKGANVITLRKNRGKGSALRFAFKLTSGNIIITMDADGIDNPNEIGKLIAPLKKGADLVIGTRFYPSNGILHKLGNLLLKIAFSFSIGQQVTDVLSGYMAIKKTALQKLELESNGFEIDPEIILWSFHKRFLVKEVPIKPEPARFYYISSIGTLRVSYIMAKLSLRILTS